MRLTQAIVGQKNCTVTTYATEKETNELRQKALQSGAKEDGILSNIKRNFKKESDKRLRTQGAFETPFFPIK